ncbi:biotin--[acetyl-CoA-carboxylase] ligase [Sulfurovum sp. bin170]|uniref:biotin--[acetyl-CoA-carboxylase] ligase n=1 Tax=Sulfurovum sp. bin170 TaxID=2695268 RepID=UPI0013DECAE0|nr:biotin--[acetyl-CoA-carboxylase] ligase [Sulfurovum sp. bin170]NEW60319.1 biotin--[acetyl-CoA-carboxylase] ligase [Sulfurovum sp. bin170]
MDIVYFDELDSTQTYLIEQIKSKKLSAPIALMAKRQTAGVGSRENSWEGGEGNLFFSFAVNLDDLPKDLPLNSVSIYFSYIMKEVLEKFSSNIWLKWPNDLYYFKHKIGGTITKKLDTVLLCGMGINLKKNSNGFEALNLNIEADFLLESYLKELENYPSWKQIFSKYALEFEITKRVSAHIQGEYKSLENAVLSQDGSLIINNKRVYSLR